MLTRLPEVKGSTHWGIMGGGGLLRGCCARGRVLIKGTRALTEQWKTNHLGFLVLVAQTKKRDNEVKRHFPADGCDRYDHLFSQMEQPCHARKLVPAERPVVISVDFQRATDVCPLIFIRLP